MFDTIIIGAGIAGLSAGQFLIQNDHSNFLILECGNMIGGRIRNIEFHGKNFSIGPGWIHGQKGNPIYDIINDIGIDIKECECGEDNFFVWDVKEGKEVTKQFEEKACFFEETFLNSIEDMKNKKITPDQSVADVLIHSEIFQNQSDLDKTVIFATKEIYMGAPMKEVSGRIDLQLDQIYNLDDDEINYQIIDPMGMIKLVDYLSQTCSNKVRLNSTVKKILWDESSHVATVITNDEKFDCKNVIVTLQCDLLLKNIIAFEPEIPNSKLTAWQHVHSVNYCRLFAKFPLKFWPNKDWIIPIISGVDTFNELILWQNAFKQNLCSEEDNILICHFTTGYSRGFGKFNVDKQSLTELVTESLRSTFPLTYCKPDDVLLVSHWDQDRFSGSFSVIAPGFTDDMIDDLDKSVGPLHFAGESVSVQLTGTMQAAYITGRKAAKSTLN